MIQALRRPGVAGDASAAAAKRTRAAPLRAVAGFAPGLLDDEQGLRDRMNALRMSDEERDAAMEALQLGRVMGNVLLRWGRAMRRWFGRPEGAPHLRHESYRHLVRMRRSRLYRRGRPGRGPM